MNSDQNLAQSATMTAVQAVSVSTPITAERGTGCTRIRVGNIGARKITAVRKILAADGWAFAWEKDAHTARGGAATVIVVGDKTVY